MSHVFIFAGELSADTYGAQLIQRLKKKLSPLCITGVGGPDLRALGVSGPCQMEDFSVMGFSDVLFSLPRLMQQFKKIQDYILDTQPDIVIFIDSPSFSLRMATALRKNRFRGRLVQYISPTVWAWGKKRIQKMESTMDLLLTIYPFEESLFANTSLNVKYVGHPLIEIIGAHRYDPEWSKIFKIKDHKKLIAIFPGSRPAEIQRNLPKQIEAAKFLQKQQPELAFAISCAHDSHMEMMQTILQENHFRHHDELFLIPRTYTYDLMRRCQSAIAKSGTITLELAFHACPTVVVYALTWLNRLYAKHILKLSLPHYCIVNILAGKKIFPELIEQKFTAQNLFHELKNIHFDGPLRENCLRDCQQIKTMFPEQSASENAAAAIMSL